MKTGFHVSNGILKDANNNSFVIRGINNPHIWFDNEAFKALDLIVNTDCNTVRVVWEVKGLARRLQQIIDRCKTLKMVVMPELHDATGKDGVEDLIKMAQYWVSNDVRNVLDDNRQYVLVNIANEWSSRGISHNTWRDAYKECIKIMRNAGIANTLVIDGAEYGQNLKCIQSYGQQLLDYDPQHNLLFSVHMYGDWNNSAKIVEELQKTKNQNLPLIVGEFGYNYDNGNNNLNCKADAQTVMNECFKHGIGYLAWSWSGNDYDNKWLNMTDSADWSTMTEWGELVVNGNNGIKNTALYCTIFNSISPEITIYDFENSTEGWNGVSIVGGPWAVTEWQSNGGYSLKADVEQASNQKFSLNIREENDFSEKSYLRARVRHAQWGNPGSGMTAKIYVKTGDNWSWYDGGETQITADKEGTVLSLNLTDAASLNKVKEVGVEFSCGNDASGKSAVYIDYITLQ